MIPDQALELSNALIAKAQRSDNATLLASSLSVGIRLLLLVGNLRALDDWAGQLIAVATEQGFPHWRGREPFIAGGPRSKIVRWRRGYRSSAAVRALTGPPGPRHLCPITSPSWPGHVRSLAKLRRPGLYWTPFYKMFSGGGYGITCTIPFTARGAATPTGVFHVDLSLDRIATFLSDIRIGDHGAVFLLDRRGRRVVSPAGEHVAAAALAVESVAPSSSG